MPHPFANLSPIDPASLPAFGTWTAGLPAFDDWTEGLAEALADGEPEFDANENPEINTKLRLSGDRSHMRTPTRRLFIDYRANPDALKHLKRLPAAGQSLHGLISGKYALFDMVPALMERTGEHIADLYLCTLGFSKRNGADLCGMLDARQVRRVSLVCSHYFKATSGPIYDEVVPALISRGQRVVAMRTHCKLILARMAGGARYVVESSANLRSCVNVEQFVMTRCPRLYQFHRQWLEQEILVTSPGGQK